MPEAVQQQSKEEAHPSIGYQSSWEHLSDELRRLDLLIRLRFQQQPPAAPPGLLDQLKGLVISDEEVAHLLQESGSGPDSGKALTAEQAELIESLEKLTRQIQERRAASAEEKAYLSLPALADLFRLTRFEEQCLLICLAPELDRKYEKLYAYIQDDVTRKKPSVSLALDLLQLSMADKLAARAVFDPQAPLLKYRLVQMFDGHGDGPSPLLSRFLKLDDRIVNFLLGFKRIDTRIAPFARVVSRHTVQSPTVNEGLLQRLRNFFRAQFDGQKPAQPNIIFHLFGPYGSGKQTVVEAAAAELNMPVICGDVEKMMNGQMPFEDAVWLLAREAALLPAVLCLERTDCLLAEEEKNRAGLQSLLSAIRTYSQLTFLVGEQVWHPQGVFQDEVFIPINLAEFSAKATKQTWQDQANGHHQFAQGTDWGILASKFNFRPGQVRDALAAADHLARWRSPENPAITMDDLHAACRDQSTPKLSTLARKIEPKYAWEDIVLPEDQLSQLKEICRQAKYREKVYGEWGFGRKLSRGRGLNALFFGPPGTGKTMAAEVIAKQLQLDLYQIDLSQVVSKYIGETEKNLHKIFEEAQSSNAILSFGEADTLISKRTEVRDAHDRYANIEVGYLLQKMEEYEGIAILDTNMRSNIDEAFVRRMQFIVEFPFPDEESRRRIWQVTFPRETPLAPEVDFSLLARTIKLAGGNIKNIGLASAFYAASDGRSVGLPHLAEAARREFQKIGRTWSDEGLSHLKKGMG